jgi:N-acetylmuramoyl-L-alanine amidase
MQPYVIKQGDYLALLAYQFGFDANTVWNDPANADLQKLRPDPNILWPTDVLYIPNQNVPPATHKLEPGTTNTFVSDAPTTTVSIQFKDDSLASQAYTVPELPELTGLTTDGSGLATLTIPVTLDVFTISFTESGLSVTCNVGSLDPVGTLSGVLQRLQHLGYVTDDATVASLGLDAIRAALRAFKVAQTPAAPPPPSTPAPSDSSPPPSSPPESSPEMGGPSSSDSGSGPVSSPPPSSVPPPSDSSPPSSASSSSAAPVDNAGLSDDGTLDDETSKQLVAAHGC